MSHWISPVKEISFNYRCRSRKLLTLTAAYALFTRISNCPLFSSSIREKNDLTWMNSLHLFPSLLSTSNLSSYQFHSHLFHISVINIDCDSFSSSIANLYKEEMNEWSIEWILALGSLFQTGKSILGVSIRLTWFPSSDINSRSCFTQLKGDTLTDS